jgi:dephospho-CoA kinase
MIGICGKKFHGKDTIANYLIQRFGFTKVSLADPLKKGVQEIFGLTDNQLWGN